MTDPFRATIHYCFPADSIEDAADIAERVDDAIEAITGIPTEGGDVERMDRRDLVEGGPLQKRILADTRSEPHP